MVQRWQNLWFSLTIAAFILGNFWLYAIFAIALLLIHRLTPVNALSAYGLLLIVVPAASTDVPGFGLINYFFAINQPRLLALVLLAPAALALLRHSETARLGSTFVDKCFLSFLLLTAVLQLRENNITSTLRGCFYLMTDMFLPYYVASRAVRRLQDFKLVMTAYVMAVSLLGLVAVFELLRHWKLYTAMTSALGLSWGYGGYLGRDGLLRAAASAGHPIVLGYMMTVGLGYWFYLRGEKKFTLRGSAPVLLMGAGLLAALSRGPWVGAVAMVLAFTFTGHGGMRKALQLVAAGAATLATMATLSIGQRVLNLLPFIGQTEAGNVEYRRRLIDNALIVIERNLWLGSTNYMQTPEMQAMIQGQGIIDIVNSYIGVALNYGVIGLALFAGFFASILWSLWRKQARLSINDERRTLGRSLLATLVGIVVIISTVSDIVVVPHLAWLTGGLGVACLTMLRRGTDAPARTT